MKHKLVKGFLRNVIIVGMLAFSVLSCRQFFTTSLAPWAARDPASLIPPVTTSNIDDLLDQSANNPDQSLALLDTIADAVTTASAADAAVLQAAALTAASNASGVATAVLQNTGTLLDTMQNNGDIIPVISDAISDLSNLAPTADLLAAILPAPSTPSTPAFNAFVAQASPEDLAMAAIVLLASEAQASGGVDTYISTFDPQSGFLSDTEALAVALASAAATSYADSGGTGPLADILAGLNLTTL